MSQSLQRSHTTPRYWLQALLDTLPLCIAVIPWGILCGSLGLQAGLTPLQSQAMSLFVFAGAAQLSGTSMIGAATPAGTLWSSTFIISARHLLYSANFRHHILSLPLRWRLALGFLLTDEMYALSSSHTQQHGVFDRHYALITGAIFYLFWNIATAAGILIGGRIEGLDGLGLEFAVAATFIALVVPTIREKATLGCVIVTAVSILLLNQAGVGNALLIAAGAGMATGYLLDRKSAEE